MSTKAEQLSAKQRAGTATIESMIGMSNERLLKMSDVDIIKYLQPALEVIPAVDPAKSEFGIRSKGAAARIKRLPPELNLEGDTGFGGRRAPRKKKEQSELMKSIKNRPVKTLAERQRDQLAKVKAEMIRDGVDVNDLYHKKKP